MRPLLLSLALLCSSPALAANCGNDPGASLLLGFTTGELEPLDAYRVDAQWLLDFVQPWQEPLRIYRPPAWNAEVKDDELRISSKDGALFAFEEAMRSKLERLMLRNALEVATDKLMTQIAPKGARVLCQELETRPVLGGTGFYTFAFIAASNAGKTGAALVYLSTNGRQTPVYTSTALFVAPSRSFGDLAKRAFTSLYAQVFYSVENCLPGGDTDRDRVGDCVDRYPRDPMRSR